MGKRSCFISSRDGILGRLTVGNELRIDAQCEDGEPIHAVAINSAETLIAYGMSDGRVTVGSLPAGQLLCEVSAHHDIVTTLRFNSHEDGNARLGQSRRRDQTLEAVRV